jgi:hypothetical protein
MLLNFLNNFLTLIIVIKLNNIEFIIVINKQEI